METQTRFDLNAAIQNWRQELAAQPDLTPDARRELETHLRDTVAELQRRRLNDEESFWLARRRIGQPHEVAEEFVKAEPAKTIGKYLFWAALAIFLNEFLGSIRGALRVVSRESDFADLLNVLMFVLFITPWIIGVLMATGRFSSLCSKLDSFIKNRSLFRFTMLMLVLLAVLLDEFSWQIMAGGSSWHVNGSIPFLYVIQSMPDSNTAQSIDATTGIAVMFGIRLLTLMTLVWVLLKLVPTQNRKVHQQI
jgi:hypothetical protein